MSASLVCVLCVAPCFGFIMTIFVLCVAPCFGADEIPIPGATDKNETAQCLTTLGVQTAWYDFSGELQAGIATRWREDDIVIAAPAKSGTTWTMNIVHQLRTRNGDEKMIDLYNHVHWLEFYDHPHRTAEDMWHRWSTEPYWFPRAFKTHAEPPKVPYDPKVRYVVVMRDPRDAIVSMYPFMHAHTEELLTSWNLSAELRSMLRPESTADAFNGFFQKGQTFIDFLKGWWPLKGNDNVLMMHYTDMKQNHAQAVQKIHDFLGFGLSSAQLSNVARLSSFKYMKEHGEKFALINSMRDGVRVLKPGGMVRTGLVGNHEAEGLSAEHLKELQALVDKQLSPSQAKWLWTGAGVFES